LYGIASPTTSLPSRPYVPSKPAKDTDAADCVIVNVGDGVDVGVPLTVGEEVGVLSPCADAEGNAGRNAKSIVMNAIIIANHLN
jgi:hypothetical protein